MNKTVLIAAAVVTGLSTGATLCGMPPLFAADTQPSRAPAAETAKTKAAEGDLIRVSEDASATMHSLGSTRLAIFNGRPDDIRTFIHAAATHAAAAVKDADKYALDTKESLPGDLYVPFDANLTVSESFVLNEQNAKHLTTANEHLRKGERKEAMEVLKLGEVGTVVSASLMPVKFAKQHIDEAAKLITEDKYYEANLALKAVEDAIVVETYGMDAIPAPKTKG